MQIPSTIASESFHTPQMWRELTARRAQIWERGWLLEQIISPVRGLPALCCQSDI